MPDFAPLTIYAKLNCMLIASITTYVFKKTLIQTKDSVDGQKSGSEITKNLVALILVNSK